VIHLPASYSSVSPPPTSPVPVHPYVAVPSTHHIHHTTNVHATSVRSRGGGTEVVLSFTATTQQQHNNNQNLQQNNQSLPQQQNQNLQLNNQNHHTHYVFMLIKLEGFTIEEFMNLGLCKLMLSDERIG